MQLTWSFLPVGISIRVQDPERGLESNIGLSLLRNHTNNIRVLHGDYYSYYWQPFQDIYCCLVSILRIHESLSMTTVKKNECMNDLNTVPFTPIYFSCGSGM